MPLTFIGSQSGSKNNSTMDPFNEIIEPVIMTVKINEDFTPTIKGDTDFEGWADFKISLDGSRLLAYGNECTS